MKNAVLAAKLSKIVTDLVFIEDKPQTSVVMANLETVIFGTLMASEKFGGTPREMTIELLDMIVVHILERLGTNPHGGGVKFGDEA